MGLKHSKYSKNACSCSVVSEKVLSLRDRFSVAEASMQNAHIHAKYNSHEVFKKFESHIV